MEGRARCCGSVRFSRRLMPEEDAVRRPCRRSAGLGALVVQELVREAQLPLDIVKLSVHETQSACEQRAGIASPVGEDLYQQRSPPITGIPSLAQVHAAPETFTCIPT